MRIAILVSGLPPHQLGGAEIAAAQIAKHAALAGHDVHIITPGIGTLDQIPVRKVRTWEKRYIRGLACVPGMVGAIRRIRPDIVHVQSLYMAPGAIAARLLLGTPYLLYERGGVELPNPTNRITYPLAMRLANRVVAQTECQKRSLLQHHKREIEVIPNGVDLSLFNGISRETARRTLGWPSDALIVLAVGRCRPEKNFRDFILAAECFHQPHFLLIGAGDQLDKLREIGEEGNVEFLGDKNPKLIPTYMSGADILVNTSLSEGFPLTVLEGMAAGLPIVAPNVNGIPEIVTDGVNGILTQPRSYVSTEAAIRKLLMSPELRRCMGENNRIKAKEYTWDKVVEKLYGGAHER